VRLSNSASRSNRHAAEGHCGPSGQGRDRAHAIADELRDRVEAAQRLAREADAAAETAQIARAEAEADAAERRGRGRLARAWRAWRGE
jgi:hypothetical protein